MTRPVSGILEVGHITDTFEVQLFHPGLEVDGMSVIYMLSPSQARQLAFLLLDHAFQASRLAYPDEATSH